MSVSRKPGADGSESRWFPIPYSASFPVLQWSCYLNSPGARIGALSESIPPPNPGVCSANRTFFLLDVPTYHTLCLLAPHHFNFPRQSCNIFLWKGHGAPSQQTWEFKLCDWKQVSLSGLHISLTKVPSGWNLCNSKVRHSLTEAEASLTPRLEMHNEHLKCVGVGGRL